MPKVTIDLEDLVQLQTKAASNFADQFNKLVEANVPAAQAVADFKRQLITQALKHTGGNVSKAGRLLGVTGTTIHSWVNKYKIDVD